jgi:hypothetical protein
MKGLSQLIREAEELLEYANLNNSIDIIMDGKVILTIHRDINGIFTRTFPEAKMEEVA